MPRERLVESKSRKLFLRPFRNHGASQEDGTLTITKPLEAVLEPAWLRIGGYWYRRGGTPIDVCYHSGAPPRGQWLPDLGVPPRRAPGQALGTLEFSIGGSRGIRASAFASWSLSAQHQVSFACLGEARWGLVLGLAPGGALRAEHSPIQPGGASMTGMAALAAAGLLPTAKAGAETAAHHASFAALKPEDLAWTQPHAGHVMHVTGPSVEPAGPGLGYSVQRAAQELTQHPRFAASSEAAPDNVKLNASASNVVGRLQQIIGVGERMQAASGAAGAAPLGVEVEGPMRSVMPGGDANGDGIVSRERDRRRPPGGRAAYTVHTRRRGYRVGPMPIASCLWRLRVKAGRAEQPPPRPAS